jgi:hypothetical protein
MRRRETDTSTCEAATNCFSLSKMKPWALIALNCFTFLASAAVLDQTVLGDSNLEAVTAELYYYGLYNGCPRSADPSINTYVFGECNRAATNAPDEIINLILFFDDNLIIDGTAFSNSF